MDRVFFNYNMRVAFDAAVCRHHYALRCIPSDNHRQTIDTLTLNVTDSDWQSKTKDNFGNKVINGYIGTPHTEFEVDVSGTLHITTLDYEQLSCGINDRLFLYATPLTTHSEIFQEYQECFDTLSDYDKALAIMHYIHSTMSYTPNSTDVSTTAAEAFMQKKGVCQDYAHIMITLCRMNRIPARYVVGILHGEGESHAWVEALCGNRWYGFDPTNDLLVNHEYVKISHGRDYRDCVICRGIFFGKAHQSQSIKAVFGTIRK